MHPSRHPIAGQQRRVQHHADRADSYAMFNLLTAPRLFDHLEASLPEHRERLFPPTETLSLFLAQALSADGSCRQVVNDAKRQVTHGTLAYESNVAPYTLI